MLSFAVRLLLILGHVQNISMFKNLKSCPIRCHCTWLAREKVQFNCSNPYSYQKYHFPKSVVAIHIDCLNSQDTATHDASVVKTDDNKSDGLIFPAGLFQKFNHVESITISNCNINSFSSKAFANLPQLSSVKLENLPITELTSDIFENSVNLKSIAIVNCVLCTNLGTQIFQNLVHLQFIKFIRLDISVFTLKLVLDHTNSKLLKFQWSRSSSSKTIPVSTFQKFHQLRTLDLSHNRLTDLQFLEYTSAKSIILEDNMELGLLTNLFHFHECQGCSKTKLLDLSACGLQFFDPYILKPFFNLEKLILKSNALQVLSSDILQLVPKLLLLDLRENPLITLSSQFESLVQISNKEEMIHVEKLRIDTQSMHCNCEIGWMLTHPRLAQNIVCATTCCNATDQSGKGQFLVDLTLFDLQCAAPSVPVFESRPMPPAGPNVSFPRRNVTGVFQFKNESSKFFAYIFPKENLTLRCLSLGDPTPKLQLTFLHETLSSPPTKSEITIPADPFRQLQFRVSHESIYRLPKHQLLVTCMAINSAGQSNSSLTISAIEEEDENGKKKEIKPVIKIIKSVGIKITDAIALKPQPLSGFAHGFNKHNMFIGVTFVASFNIVIAYLFQF